MIKQFADIPVITCFPGELNQVFMHVFRNAAQAISGFGTITVSTWTDQRKVFVRVEDTGRGIEPERVPTLFVPTLYRSGTRVRAGLGLFASSQIIERHHDLERRLNRAVACPPPTTRAPAELELPLPKPPRRAKFERMTFGAFPCCCCCSRGTRTRH